MRIQALIIKTQSSGKIPRVRLVPVGLPRVGAVVASR